MKRSPLALAGLGVLLALGDLGCSGSTPKPPKQLTEARATYHRAAADPAVMLVPSDLVEARRALDAAEKSFKDSGDSGKTESLAYVAQRRAVAVQAKGGAMKALEQKKVALAELDRVKARRATAAREELEREKGQLAAAQEEAAQRQARAAAQEKVREELCRVEGVKAEESARGLILTLSADETFAPGKAALQPKAKERLDALANALKSDDRPLLVVGYTDSRGSALTNDRISSARAGAVRDYLTEHGVDPARVRAEGLGGAAPVASNATAKGRAENRRVEIVVEKAPGAPTTP